LAAVAHAGDRFGLKLHYDKFQLMCVQCQHRIRTPAGQDLTAESEMTYLGTVLSEGGRLGPELGRRLGACRAEFKALSKVWSHSNLPWKRKLIIFRSLIESKLLYGLACCVLIKAEKRRLDGFQARCIRQLMGIKPAYYSRVSNKTVLDRAGHVTASSLLAQQQLMMLGRILRAPLGSALRTSALVDHTLRPTTAQYVRRVGRPRLEWIPLMLQEAHARNTSTADLITLASDPEVWRRFVHNQ